MEEILQQLISLVQETAPAVWAIARRQVMSNTIISVIWTILSLLSSVALARLTKYCHKKEQEDKYSNWAIVKPFAALFAAVAFFAVFLLLTDVVRYLVNPDYYSIKVLTNLIN